MARVDHDVAGVDQVHSSMQLDPARAVQRGARLGLLGRLEAVHQSLPETRCDGCALCCIESPGVFYVEHLHLLAVLPTLERERPGLILRRSLAHFLFRLVEQDARCPFLEAGRCLVYDRRPLACRLFGLVSAADREAAEQQAREAASATVAALAAQGITVSAELAGRGIASCDRVRDMAGRPVQVDPEAVAGRIAHLDAALLPQPVVLREFCFVPFAQRMVVRALGPRHTARLQFESLRRRRDGETMEQLLDEFMRLAGADSRQE